MCPARMAYRFLSRDASVTEGMRRIAAAEFAHVRAGLSDKALPVDRKVHEGRKATKRLRALLRLTAPVFPEAKAEIDALRDAAAKLSALRDRGALAETLVRLKLPEAAVQAMAAALEGPDQSSAAAQRRLLTAFRRDMGAIEARAAGWTLEREGWKALAPGLTACQHRFRKSMKAALKATSEEPLHDFRKRAKDHWYQTLLLREAFPDVMDGYAAAGEDLCADLGSWRDLGLLDAAVRALDPGSLAEADLKLALKRIEKAQARALRHAFRTAGKLAWETPEDYSARLKGWWASRA